MQCKHCSAKPLASIVLRAKKPCAPADHTENIMSQIILPEAAPLQLPAVAEPLTLDHSLAPTDPRCRRLLEQLRACLPIKPSQPGQADQPVVIYPGLHGDALSLRPLLRLCRRLGYAARDWGRGMNIGPGDDIDAYLASLAADLRVAAERCARAWG